MKINFSDSLYESLLGEAKLKGLSLPKLIITILQQHYSSTQNSHTKVETISESQHKTREGFSSNT